MPPPSRRVVYLRRALAALLLAALSPQLAASAAAAAASAASAATAATAPAAPPAAVTARVALGEPPLLRLPPAYLGFTIDFWPPNVEDFGTSTVNLVDLGNARLRGLARALSPATLRLGGSLDNVVTYLVGGVTRDFCERRIVFRGQNYSGPGLCLNASRFEQFADFVENVLAPGSALVFGLQLDLGAAGAGPWNGTNALDFLRAAAALPAVADALARGGVEVGEETNPDAGSPGFAALLDAYGGVGAALAALWPDAAHRPPLLGPCSGMGQNVPPWETFTQPFMQNALPLGLGGFVMHSYNNDGGPDGWNAPGFLNQTAMQASGLRLLLDAQVGGAQMPLWCGECGPHNGGGIVNVTDRARSSFWYTDALLGLPLLGVNRFSRQSLAGGRYGLLANDDFAPRPDYFAALAYARLAGARVMNVTLEGGGAAAAAASLRVYARCAAAALALPPGAVTLAYINIDPALSFAISVPGLAPAAARTDYVLAPLGGDDLAQALTLNGVTLAVNGNDAPTLAGAPGDAAAPVLAAPRTFGYVVYTGAGAAACK